MAVVVPSGLEWWRGVDGGGAWLDALPTIVDEAAQRFGVVDVGAAFEPASVAFVAPATLADGRRAILKVNYPEDESELEGAALARWNGDGAARLIDEDRARRALLIERLTPGASLSRQVDDDDERTRIAARVLRRLHVPIARSDGDAFRNAADDAARWSTSMARDYDAYGATFPRRVLDEAVDHARVLSSPPPSSLVLCHQDLHAGNVLSSARAGDKWRAIDPKPVAAEAAFDVAAIVRDTAGARDKARVWRRLDVVADELGFDAAQRERARMWSIVHTLAWGVADGERRFLDGHVAVATWLCGR